MRATPPCHQPWHSLSQEVKKGEAKEEHLKFEDSLIFEPDPYAIYFTDGSKGEGKNGPSSANAFVRKDSNGGILAIKAYNTGGYPSIADAEVEGVINEPTLYLTIRRGKRSFICADSQAALQRLKKQDGDKRALEAKKLASKIATEKGVSITIRWTPSHVGIEGNELADKVAREALSLPEPKRPLVTLSFLKSSIRARTLDLWEREWALGKEGKGKIYSMINPNPKLSLRPKEIAHDKATISAFIQLKTGIGYLRSYQFRLRRTSTDRCFRSCHSKQDTKHLILECPFYNEERAILRKALKKERLPVTLPILFNTSKGLSILIDFLRATKIGTANWYKEEGHKP